MAIAFGATVIGFSATATMPAVAASSSSKGRAPNSPLCQALRTLSPTLSKDASDSKHAAKTHNWAKQKAADLAGLQVQAQEYAALLANPHGVPKSVTSAVPTALKTAQALEKDLQHAKNNAQFTSPVSAIIVITYNKGQSKLLEYFAQQCGGGPGSLGSSKGNAATGH